MSREDQQERQEQEIKICRDCGAEIVWKEGQNRQGETKFFPFNYPPLKDTAGRNTNYERHRCAEYNERRGSQYKSMSTADKTKGIPCRVCGAPITFSEDQRSPRTGKLIPLELTLERHQHRSSSPSSSSLSPNNNNIPDEREIWGEEE